MKLPGAPLVGGVLGGAVALVALAVPTATLESMVMASGLPAIFAAAEPPLGFTAHLLVALAAGGAVGLAAWFGLASWLDARRPQDETFARRAVAPVIRRADAHPDAPPRPPLLATRDLGAPFLDPRPVAADPEPLEIEEPAPLIVVTVEQDLPKDLDQPLSAYDPAAVPDVPMPAPEALPSLQRAQRPAVFDESERFEVFELTPPVRPTPSLVVDAEPAPAPREEAITRPETDATIHALLERLERGVVRKATAATTEAMPEVTPTPMPISVPAPRVERRARPRGLEDTLVTLRNLAQRA
ncbi:hypothetical protein FHS95_002642 [Sphingomonas naasensis]|uniref:Uncharacterized protein n=1 Tax=Sphingomonas naasensis TaxID=1344951 RepID=A0A4S1WPZ0_9SPHN|nr:hypothetical protein [Sphingomonas naasensis]NIJ20950.1 hypothetical protein [Sphingomonas naasensis]TGX43336.1 hypothetical protein E5A74_09240 [Sphingomonas naasensis]